ETFGPWSKEAQDLVHTIGTNLNQISGDSRSKQIAQYVEDPYLEHIRNHTYAYEIWESLCNTHEKKRTIK
ncbi:hypothetical protein ILUMI_02191, partial [Ignelater luminosus]